jgi:hypothetical protein
VSRWPRSRVVGLAADALAWRAADGSVQHAAHTDGLGDALQGTKALDIVAADDVAVHWLQQPPDGAASLAELKRVAAARCVQLHGGNTDDWWVAGDWHATKAFPCAALPRRVLARLESQTSRLPISMRWYTATALALGARPSAQGWQTMRSPGCVTVWHRRAQLLDAVFHVRAGVQEQDAAVLARIVEQVRLERLRDPQLAAQPPTLPAVPPDADEATHALRRGLQVLEPA